MIRQASAFETAGGMVLDESGAWRALIADDPAADGVLEELSSEWAAEQDQGSRIVDAAGVAPERLIGELRTPDNDLVVIKGLHAWTDAGLAALDINRSALQRQGPVILWLPMQGLVRLFQHAPNLRSWIGGSVFHAVLDRGLMSDAERQEHLDQLRTHYGKSDEDVIREAQEGILPSDPEYTEWLVLMGRPDLARR
jgi:hypothetical protein